MPSLLDVQRAVRTAIVAQGVDGALAAIGGAADKVGPRLAIHRNTFVATLGRALGLTFPAVARLVGPDFFAAATQAFADANPPRSARLDGYGVGFPAFLAQFAPAASLPYIADVARLEHAVSGALRAPDARPIDARQLAAIDGADCDRLRLAPHPSVALLHSPYPVDLVWRAVLANDDAALRAIDLFGGPVWLIVQRDADDAVAVMRLAAGPWRFANALVTNVPLRTALESTVGIDAPACLAEHLIAGRFVGFSVDTAEPDNTPEAFG